MNYQYKVLFFVLILILLAFYNYSKFSKLFFKKFKYLNFVKLTNDNVQNLKSISDYNIYFVKTHKTASSALQNVLIRLADKRNMRVVNNLVNEAKLIKNKSLNNKIYFIHGRHNSGLAEAAFPRNHSLFMTILRNPVDQLLSSINYFSGLRGQKENIINNIRNESLMKEMAKKDQVFCLLKNSASYDLGIVECAESYKGSEKSLVNRFTKEFDFVILTEFFNEGLVLLKNMLNLSYRDIVCLSVNQGTKKKSQKDRQWAESIIGNVSNADVILYNYYLKKYQKISVLIKNEVDKLKKEVELYQNKCTDGREEKYFYGDVPSVGYSLRKNLTDEFKDFCWKLTITELNFLSYINKKSKNIWKF